MAVRKNRAVLWLGFIGLLMGAVYVLGFVRPALIFDWYQRADPNFYQLYPKGSNLHLAMILAFAVLGFFYYAGWSFGHEVRGKAAWVVVLGGSLLFGLVLLYLYPYDAADIFDYIIHGRMTGVYGGNPYRNIPNDYPDDPFLPFVAWKTDPSPYGPLWELLAGLTARLAGDDFVPVVFAYKLIPGIFLLLSILITAVLLHRWNPERALPGVLLLAWNPVVLYETWGNGHNDIVMIFWVLAAVWAFTHERYSLAFLALTAGTLVKFIPALLFPAALVLTLRAYPGLRERFLFLLRTGAACLVLAGLLYAPFWFGPESLTVVERTELFTSSIPAVIYYTISTGFDTDPSRWIALIAFGLTAVFAIFQAERAADRRPWESFTQASFNVLAFYLLLTCLWFQQWYTLWLLALAPLLRSRSLKLLAVVFGFAALSKQFAAGAVFYVPPDLPQPWRELGMTIGVMGVPWIAAGYAVWRRIRNKEWRMRSQEVGGDGSSL